MQQSTAASHKLGYGDYLRFRDLVLERSGLYFPEKKRSELENGLVKALAHSALEIPNGNLDAYYNHLSNRQNPASRAEMEQLINALTVGETHFFRNQAQFNALALHVLPEIINRKRKIANTLGLQPQLRLWSAGCASGEEPYSLAILLKELLPDIDQWNLFILATDINHHSLARAQAAIYSDWSFREQRAKILQSRYFSPETAPGGAVRYRLHHEIKQMVTFASLNLIEDDYPAIHNNTVSMDLVMCRNVTIYFTENTTQQIVERFYHGLMSNGWLVVGHSEPSLEIYRKFQSRSYPNTFFYQRVEQPNLEWISQHVGFPAQSLPTQTPAASRQKKVEDTPVRENDPYQIAKILLDQGRIEEALAKLHHLLMIRPEYAAACGLLGQAYANLGHWTEAQHWCKRALSLDPLQAEAYYVLALVSEHAGHLELALDLLKKAIYLKRDMPLYHFSQAIFCQKLGRPEPAKRACQNALKILETWPPDALVPDTGGSTARHLLNTIHKIRHNLDC